MAKLSDLTRNLASSTGMPVTSLSVIARVLREGGLIATGGRGLSAAKMEPMDAASLLLAIAVQGDHTKAADIVKKVGAMTLDETTYGLNQEEIPSDGSLLGLRPGQKLIDVLASILELYSLTPPPAWKPTLGPSRKIGFSESLAELMEDISPRYASFFPHRISLIIDRDDECIFPFLEFGENMLSFGNGQKKSIARMFNSGEGIECRVTLRPNIIHSVVCCIRDEEDQTFKGLGERS